MRLCPSKERGFGLVEIVVGATVLSVSLLSVSYFFQSTLRTSRNTQSVIQANYLLEEGMEVVKFLRDSNYTANIKNMSTTTTYYLSWGGANWATTTTPIVVDNKFTRRFTLSDVKRDAVTQDISPGGVYDPNAKKVTMAVVWSDPVLGTSTRSIEAYITNISGN